VRKHFLPIWFFIGVLLASYGILILGVGTAALFRPSERSSVALPQLHLQIWWGAGMLLFGLFFVLRFWPRSRWRGRAYS
jgi:hypothetical protein